MKYVPRAKKWCVVFLVLLIGCHSLQHINSNDENSQNNLEASLIKDIADGRLDMTLEEACLIASGVNSAKKWGIPGKDEPPDFPDRPGDRRRQN